MIAIKLDSIDTINKVFDLDDWFERNRNDFEKDISVKMLLTKLESLDLTDTARDFLYEHDLYYPRQFRFEWSCTETLNDDGDIYDLEGQFYLPDEYAVLFKLVVL